MPDLAAAVTTLRQIADRAEAGDPDAARYAVTAATAAGGAEPMLTVDQVADRYQVHPDTVRRAIRSRDLRAVRVGQQWRVSTVALAEWTRSDG